MSPHLRLVRLPGGRNLLIPSCWDVFTFAGERYRVCGFSRHWVARVAA